MHHIHRYVQRHLNRRNTGTYGGMIFNDKRERESERNEKRLTYFLCFSSFGTDSLQNDNDYKNSFALLQDERRRETE